MCECDNGKTVCSKRCPAKKCKNGQILGKLRRECCPVCIDNPNTCLELVVQGELTWNNCFQAYSNSSFSSLSTIWKHTEGGTWWPLMAMLPTLKTVSTLLCQTASNLLKVKILDHYRSKIITFGIFSCKVVYLLDYAVPLRTKHQTIMVNIYHLWLQTTTRYVFKGHFFHFEV